MGFSITSYQHILLPIDGSPLSERTISPCVALAKGVGARITGLGVGLKYEALVFADSAPLGFISEDDYNVESRRRADLSLDKIARAAVEAQVDCRLVFRIDLHPYEAILKTARERDCDLIFMASHGYNGYHALIPGGETLKVLVHGHLPVLVYR